MRMYLQTPDRQNINSLTATPLTERSDRKVSRFESFGLLSSANNTFSLHPLGLDGAFHVLFIFQALLTRVVLEAS
jgi:hypothetical protein